MQIPELTRGRFFPPLLGPRRRIDRYLPSVAQVAYVLGASTRKVDDVMAALDGCKLSRREVSRIYVLLEKERAVEHELPLR